MVTKVLPRFNPIDQDHKHTRKNTISANCFLEVRLRCPNSYCQTADNNCLETMPTPTTQTI